MPVSAEQLIEAAKTDDPTAAINALMSAALTERGDEVAAAKDRKHSEIFTKLEDLKPWKQFDQTPDEIRAALDEGEALRAKLKAAEAGVDPDKLEALAAEQSSEKLAKYRTQQEGILAAAGKRADDAESQVKDLTARLLDERVHRALNLSSRGIQDGLEGDVFNRLRPLFSEDAETGALVIVDPKTGSRLAGAKGEMTVAELVDGLRASNGAESWNSKGAGYFMANGSGGGEGESGQRRSRHATGKARSKMAIGEKSAFISEFGAEAFRQLPP